MKIAQILTKRAAIKGKASPLDIVFEWEDVLAEQLNVPKRNHFTKWRLVGAVCYRLPFLGRFFRPFSTSLSFDLYSCDIFRANYSCIVPCIIDFWLRKEEQLKLFYKLHDKHPIVLVSSKEVYDFLKSKDCPLRIAHWGLSISDKYKINTAVLKEKKYDAAIVGRTSKVLLGYAQRYKETHPGFVYIYQVRLPGRNGDVVYMDSDGRKVCSASTRMEYMELLRKVKVGFYSTPGVDSDRNVSYNQVTPRFLEYLVSGCHVLARYTKNPDTDFYEMDKMAPNITSYEHFERELDRALSTPIDVDKYRQYLAKHYTSTRAKELISILEEI